MAGKLLTSSRALRGGGVRIDGTDSSLLAWERAWHAWLQDRKRRKFLISKRPQIIISGALLREMLMTSSILASDTIGIVNVLVSSRLVIHQGGYSGVPLILSGKVAAVNHKG